MGKKEKKKKEKQPAKINNNPIPPPLSHPLPHLPRIAPQKQTTKNQQRNSGPSSGSCFKKLGMWPMLNY